MSDLTTTINVDFSPIIKQLEKVAIKIQETFEAKNARKELNQISDTVKEIGKGFNKAAKASKKFGDAASKAAEKADKYFQKVEKSSEKTGSFFAGLGGKAAIGVAAAGAALGGLVKVGVDSARELSQTAQLLGTTREEAAKLQPQIAALASTYDKDFNETLISANNLSKQLGVSNQEALDLIEKGFLSGADASGDFLNLIQEYPVQLKEAGLAADESIALITQNIRSGVFDDKGIDSIKEALIRLRELTPATKDAITAVFGLEESQQIFDDLNSGALKPIDAIKLLSQEFDNVDKTTQGVILADVFGGAGEDGLNFVRGLKDINLELDNLIDKDDPFIQYQKGILELQKSFQTILGSLAQTILPILNPIIKTITDTIVPLIDQIFTLVRPLITELLGLITDLITPLAPLIGEILLALTPLLTNVISAITPIIEALGFALFPVVDIIKEVLATLTPLINQLLDGLAPVIVDIVDIIGELLRALQPIVSAILPILANVLKQNIQQFTFAINVVAELARLLTDVLVVAFKILTPIIEFGSKIIQAYQEAGIALYQFLSDFFLGIIQGITDKFNTWVNSSETLSKAIEGITKALTYVYDEAVKVINAIGKFFGLVDDDVEVKVKTNLADVQKEAKETNFLLDEIVISSGDTGKNDKNDKNDKGGGGKGSGKTPLEDISKDIIALTDATTKIENELFAATQDAFTQRLLGITDTLDAEEKALERSLEEKTKLYKDGKISEEQYTAFLDATNKQRDAINAKASEDAFRIIEEDKINDQLKVIQDSFDEAKTILDDFYKERDEKLQEVGQAVIDSFGILGDGLVAQSEAYAAQAIELEKSIVEEKALRAKELAEINAEIKKLEEADFADELEREEKLKELEKERQDLIEDGEKVETESTNRLRELREKSQAELQELYAKTAFEFGKTLSELLIAGESFTKAFLTASLDALEALIPVLVAQIFGQSFAANPLLGAVLAGGLTGVLYGLLGLARSSVENFEEGGARKGGFGAGTGLLPKGAFSVINMNETGQPEFIFNAKTTAKNLKAFEEINNKDMTVFDYVKEQGYGRNDNPAFLSELTSVNRNLEVIHSDLQQLSILNYKVVNNNNIAKQGLMTNNLMR